MHGVVFLVATLATGQGAFWQSPGFNGNLSSSQYYRPSPYSFSYATPNYFQRYGLDEFEERPCLYCPPPPCNCKEEVVRTCNECKLRQTTTTTTTEEPYVDEAAANFRLVLSEIRDTKGINGMLLLEKVKLAFQSEEFPIREAWVNGNNVVVLTESVKKADGVYQHRVIGQISPNAQTVLIHVYSKLNETRPANSVAEDMRDEIRRQLMAQ